MGDKWCWVCVRPWHECICRIAVFEDADTIREATEDQRARDAEEARHGR